VSPYWRQRNVPVPLGRVANSRAATPLPDPLPGLAKSRYGVHFNPGQLCMFAGAPGAGKTTFALIAAIRMGVSCLYFSADSDEATMAARAASTVRAHTYAGVRETQTLGMFNEEYGEALNALPIRFVFDPSEPSLEDISNGIEAYTEVWGAPPRLIVVDNLMNLDCDDSNEWAGMRTAMKHLHWLARKTKACLWVLHHTSEQNEAWISYAPPRSAIQGKLTQLPELILTFAYNDDGFWVAVVKYRHGPQDPKAEKPVRMIMDFARNRLQDEPMMPGVSWN
jgi:hypothetical protein